MTTPAHDALPNPLPRPAGEHAQLRALWQVPRGWRFFTVVNNNYIGVLYVGAALLFFVLAGVLGLLMRVQLAVPDNDFLSPGTYNQFFTTHGTAMMFLFAVPAVEAMGVLLLPNMLGARDLPFPRLSAYAFWAYLVGGLVFFSSVFFGIAPDGGWFMNPPLTDAVFSPGVNSDLWLLGIGFIEISAIAGAIEIIVGVLRTRAPGMTLARMPIFAWAMLVFAVMIVFAFPAVILATLLLELERAFGWPFFAAGAGGDPLLWQHLFWFFGHPEVYIIFLPAAGMVSMIVPTMARTPLIGARWVVLALVTTAFLSFGLWVHHMFTTGIPRLSLSFFEAASMAVAIPAGMQVFAWIATFAAGRIRWTVATWFVIAFLVTFVIGGLTGVMLAVVAFDWQAHDSWFVVAHLHYVLVGGMVFPLFAAIYYWMPYTSQFALSERLGRWVCGLMFVGFNVAFLPMHVVGLAGMPRRVYTYADVHGWSGMHLWATIGAVVFFIGVALFLVDLARRFRMSASENAGNVWGAGTLEWLPSEDFGPRSIPAVAGAYPLWDRPTLADETAAGRWYLPDAPTGGRETIVTSPLDAKPQYLLRMPLPGWAPFIAALGTAAFFLLLTAKAMVLSTIAGVVAIVALWHWAWSLDPAPLRDPLPIGGGIALPAQATGSSSHAWWAVVIVLMVMGVMYACAVVSYLYLWLVSPEAWPAADALPPIGDAAIAGGLLMASTASVLAAQRALAMGRHRVVVVAIVAAIVLLAGAVGIEFYAQRAVSPQATSHGALVHLFAWIAAFFVAVVAIIGAFAIARLVAGRLDARWRTAFDVFRLFAYFAIGQTLVGLALVHLAPRVLA